jgi:hypothetical protein
VADVAIKVDALLHREGGQRRHTFRALEIPLRIGYRSSRMERRKDLNPAEVAAGTPPEASRKSADFRNLKRADVLQVSDLEPVEVVLGRVLRPAARSRTG